MKSVTDVLRRVSLFEDLSDEQLASVERGKEIRLGKGDYVKRAGDPPDGFYVVMEGQIEWTSEVRGQDVFVQSLGPGEFWGQELLLTGKPYPVSGRAVTPVRLYALEADDFWRMLSDCPSILRNLVAMVVERFGTLGEAAQKHVKLISLGTMAAGLDETWLDDLEGRLPGGHVGDVVIWLASETAGEELLREIGHASTRISELVGAVKSYSHMDKTASKQVDVHAGLNSTLIMLGHKLKKGDVEVVRDYEENLPPVCGHGGKLNQVWTNLLDNAIDAVEGHGRITIRTTSENGRVLVEIGDDGRGIPDEVRERIFQPFYTTKDVGKGTGLGLDISHRVVVEDHKGDIRVLSEPGNTRFQVRLPILPPDGA